MADYTSGFTSGLESVERAQEGEAYIKNVASIVAARAWQQKQIEDEQQRNMKAQTAAFAKLAAAQPPQPPPTTPPMAPGAPSGPMMQQFGPPGGAPPGPPPQAMAPGAPAGMPPAGGAPAPAAPVGPPTAAPPQPWKPSAAASPELGGMPRPPFAEGVTPPMPSGSPTGGGAGGPPDILPGNLLTVEDAIARVDKDKSIPEDIKYDVVRAMMPMLNAQNELTLAKWHANTEADKAASLERKRVFDQVIENSKLSMKEEEMKEKHRVDDARIRALDRKGTAAGGAAGGGDMPGGVGSTMVQDKDTGQKYVINSRSGKAWKASAEGGYKEINPNEVPKTATKIGVGGGMGAREAVFTQRELTAGSLAARDLENVAELPIDVSAGPLAGRKQGPGIFDAGKEVLANKVTPQEAQLYSVMSAGLQRSLATIEAVGLMPSGSLTHQMDAVIIKEGDTILTKISKLAQTRQIVEQGLDVMINNPRVSDDEKTKAREFMRRMEEAVPFTQHDVTNMMKAQQKNPKATLRQVMQKQKAGAISGDADKKLFQDADKILGK